MTRLLVISPAVACLILSSAFGQGDRNYSFERGSRTDFENGVVVKDKEPQDQKKVEEKGNARAVSNHVKNLADKDPRVRENSAQMLGMLADPSAVQPLIEALRDENLRGFNGSISVMSATNGALQKITGQPFGYKEHKRWESWWRENREEFIKKGETGASEMSAIRARTSNTMGLTYLQSGQYQQARQMFLDAVDKDPQIPDYRNNLGLSVMEVGDHITAITYFEETMGLNDMLPQPYMNVGTCYARMNKHIEAQYWFRKAMEKDKDGSLWEPFWTLGKEYLSKKEFHMAKELLEQAAEKSSKKRIYDPRVYRDLALTYYGMDMYHSSWWAIQQVRQDGYELDEGFVKKVRTALEAQGINPDKFEKGGPRPEPE